jgi:hypothetical protein
MGWLEKSTRSIVPVIVRNRSRVSPESRGGEGMYGVDMTIILSSGQLEAHMSNVKDRSRRIDAQGQLMEEKRRITKLL